LTVRTDDYAVPVVVKVRLVEIEEDFAEEARIKLGSALKLDFEEVDRSIGAIGQENPIETKGELLDFYGRKLIVIPI
jgi:hypothetical protein